MLIIAIIFDFKLNYHIDQVSVFLKEKVQNWNGSFVLFHEGSVATGIEIPGIIT